MTKFILTIHHDDQGDDPLDQDSPLFKLHSFNQRDFHYTDPDDMVCASCGYSWIEHPDGDDRPMFEIVNGDEKDDEPCSNFAYPEGFWLSHYEHGQRHWSIQGTVHYPDMRWDGIRTAGFLEVVVPEDEREWWDGRPDKDRLEAAKSTMEEYTNWLNGEVYGYVFENVRQEHCDMGFTHTYEGEDVSDSCWGYIGWKWLQEAVQDVTTYYDATPENTTIVDKAYGMTDYGTFFKKEDANA